MTQQHTGASEQSVAHILGPQGPVGRYLPGYEARPGQIDMALLVERALRERHHTVVEAGTGVGKALDVDTPIATPAGWTRMGDLCTGDLVFDETGSPTPIVAAFDVMEGRPCYEIVFSDGATLVADADHEWVTYTSCDRRWAGRPRSDAYQAKRFVSPTRIAALEALLAASTDDQQITPHQAATLIGGHQWSLRRAAQSLSPQSVTGGRSMLFSQRALLAAVLAHLERDLQEQRRDGRTYTVATTVQIAASLTVGTSKRLNHAVPVAGALKLPAMELPVDPYVLGVWLGDGDSGKAGLSTADPQVIAEIEQAGYITRKLAAPYHYSIHGTAGPVRSRWEPSLTTTLRQLGVVNDKHIPAAYLRASVAQRRALLAGLLDTDGTVSCQGAVEFTVTRERLARDVQALALGLGYRAYLRSRLARLGQKECGTAYTVRFTTDNPVFRLERKARAQQERLLNFTPERNRFRYIVGVRPVPPRPVRCIQVAAESHLYLAGEALIPTHNSLGYLIPSILSGKRVIISTANKALQEQLVRKDIPFLKEVLSAPFTSALVKGRSNYLCLDRFAQEEAFQTMAGGGADFTRLKAWANRTASGDVEEFTERLSDRAVLGRIVSTRRTCIGQTCTYFADCYVERMRGLAEGARIIVCNHALLLADLRLRDLGAYLLPNRDAIIIDEAHHLEDSATSALTVSLTRQDVVTLCENGIVRHHAEEATLTRLLRLNNTLFGYLERETRARGRQVVAEELPAGAEMAELLGGIAEALRAANPAKGAPGTPEERRFQNVLEWTQALADDTRLIARTSDTDSVRYVEAPTGNAGGREGQGLAIKWAPIAVDVILKDILFDRQPVICTSATLAVGERFDFFTRSVGCTDPLTLIVPSHFDFPTQAMLYVPRHLPEYRKDAAETYNVELAREMYRLLMASQGRAFCLFTSYRTLDQVYAILSEHLPFLCLKQGTLPRAELLRRFKESQPAVLFATRSFWEGVDVVGENLSLVIIDKMPFSVPDDPVVEARVARMKEQGEDWFGGMVLPTAILGLKQGFGRLIRSTADRGVVAILDSRLLTRSYGSTVLTALPPARQTTDIRGVRAFFADQDTPLS